MAAGENASTCWSVCIAAEKIQEVLLYKFATYMTHMLESRAVHHAVYFFLPGIVLALPFRVRELVFVLWPCTGKPCSEQTGFRGCHPPWN